MTNHTETINVYLEVGHKRTMAGALGWPGWCRGGADEEAALAAPVDDAELARLSTILKLCGQAFDDTVQRAAGKTLRKGPRGGGRELEGVARHVMEADGGYRRTPLAGPLLCPPCGLARTGSRVGN